jgi:hypothetical protein
MRKLSLIVATASALMAGAAVGGAAQAAPANVFNAVYTGDAAPVLQNVQYFWGGRNYCWYDGGWRGPGYYWCGYGGRRGYGWGGGYGWNGWRHGGYGPAGFGAHREHFGGGYYHGGGGFHGGGHDFHGGGGHGGGHEGGGHHH